MRSKRRSSLIKINVAVVAAVLLALTGCVPATAQTTAQRTALAQLGLGKTVAHPENARPDNAQPGGVQATTLPLLVPEQLAFDSSGNLYIADSGDHLIRAISVAGVITTVAGSGQQGFGGDGGQAVNALLDTPMGVALDSNGNLYIADTNNNRIRQVSGGVISTIAGTGTAGYSGDGGAATAAQLDGPVALALDRQGNLYIADTGNQCIRRIAGTTIATVAGNGMEGYAGDSGPATAAQLDEPTGIAVDSAGNLYIGDTNNQRIRVVYAAGGTIATIAGSGTRGYTGDGPALTTALASPSGVSVDASGNVYFADADNNRVREISGGNVTTLTGISVQGYGGDTGAATGAVLDTPRAVLAGSSAILLSDTGNNLVRTIAAGKIVSSGGVPAPAAESLVVGSALSAVYGTGTLIATFSNNGATATGQVRFDDQQAGAAMLVGQSPLIGNTASIGTGALAAGTHAIIASYAGDSNNNPIDSGIYIYIVTPAPLSAVANGINLLYGQPIPPLTGTLTGVLPQDAGKVSAVYTTTATGASDPGVYPITVALAGPAAGNYSVALGAGSGSVLIGAAPTTTTLTSTTSTPILGASLTLTATVTSATGLSTVGTVDFFNGAVKLNTAPVAVSSGIATLITNALPVGQQSLKAVYSGNVDFLGSTSSSLAVTELSPDFTIAATPAVQTVLPSQSVDYTVTLTPANSTFVYPVTLTASGLPVGVTAAFTPASISTASAAATVKFTLSAGAQARLDRHWLPKGRFTVASALVLLLPFAFWRRLRKAGSRLSGAPMLLLALLAVAVIGSIAGCGGGGFFSHATASSTVTITATCGPDTHSTSVTLTVQ